MSSKTVGVMGVITAMAAASAGGGQAAPTNEPAVPVAASYAELLTPIPNAVERLRLSDAEAASRPGRLIEAQYAPYPVPADHHHHHNWRRHRRHHHHHHHHHHSNY